MKRLEHLLVTLLVWAIRGYQMFVSPGLSPRCKYYPSCSQYALDALREYGLIRGSVLAGCRVLRCNPWSRGGYDPVGRQRLFRNRIARSAAGKAGTSAEKAGSGPGEAGTVIRRSSRRGVLRTPAIVLLAALMLLVPMAVVSCSFFPTTTTAVTTTPATSSAANVSDTEGGGTTSTTAEEAEQPGSFAKFIKPLQALFFWILEALHKYMGVSWSWAIVLLTVIVRIVLVPLTWRQIKSMRAMQALQPQLKALQEKYKNDRELLNQKVMEFYRQNNVSPFGSCLPLLLQLPVFLGLFYMLRTAGLEGLDPVEWGRWAGVFDNPQVGWLWIADITKFDIILMFLYIGSQFVASWQTARKAGGQQKAIAYVMPLVVGILMYVYKWPAGLMIYWFTSNLWTIAQQFVSERFLPIPVPVAATEGKGRTGSATKAAAGARPGPATKKAPAAAGKAPVKTAAKKVPATAGKAPAGTSGKKTPAAGGKTPAKAGGQSPPGSAGKSGGVSSGQKKGQKKATTGGKSQRPDGRASGPEGSGGT